MSNNNPIGVFDSGLGGISIWNEIHALLPNEDIIYLADSKYAPYGERTKPEIISLSIKNTDFLLDKKCKLIVAACNTATTNAIKTLRKTYDVPFIGIEPAIKPAALNTATNAIGILATKGTLSSDLFHTTTNLFANDVTVIEQVGEGIVTLIENGRINSPEMTALLKHYMQPMLDANIDYLVLGCTHYPYLVPQLLQILPKHIKIIDSGEPVARQTKTVLQNHALLNTEIRNPKLEFYTNGNPDVMQLFLKDGNKAKYQEF